MTDDQIQTDRQTDRKGEFNPRQLTVFSRGDTFVLCHLLVFHVHRLLFEGITFFRCLINRFCTTGAFYVPTGCTAAAAGPRCRSNLPAGVGPFGTNTSPWFPHPEPFISQAHKVETTLQFLFPLYKTVYADYSADTFK